MRQLLTRTRLCHHSSSLINCPEIGMIFSPDSSCRWLSWEADQRNICVITEISPETAQSLNKPSQDRRYFTNLLYFAPLRPQLLQHHPDFNLSTWEGFERVPVQTDKNRKWKSAELTTLSLFPPTRYVSPEAASYIYWETWYNSKHLNVRRIRLQPTA